MNEWMNEWMNELVYYLKLPKGYFFLNDNNRDVQ